MTFNWGLIIVVLIICFLYLKRKKHIIYEFVHPTKCGGTALEQYFEKHYKTNIIGKAHERKCKDCKHPLIILRDPYSRFLSMYKYWKEGSSDSKYKRGQTWIKKYSNVSIDEFLQMIETRDRLLFERNQFTWNVHFENYSEWIKPEDFKKTTVIIYTENLNDKIENILYQLKIKSKNIKLDKFNVSKTSENIVLNETQKKRVQQIFEYDFDLYNKVLTQKYLFRKVI